jgi:transposase
MRGADTFTESLFTVSQLEDFIPKSHPLRPIRAMVNEALVKMDALFARMYEADIKGGRPSIAPEKLLRAMLLQVFYSVRSERQLMEQTHYNLLFRWFIGLAMDDAVWVPSVFSKNRERLIEHDAVIELFNRVLEHPSSTLPRRFPVAATGRGHTNQSLAGALRVISRFSCSANVAI